MLLNVKSFEAKALYTLVAECGPEQLFRDESGHLLLRIGRKDRPVTIRESVEWARECHEAMCRDGSSFDGGESFTVWMEDIAEKL